MTPPETGTMSALPRRVAFTLLAAAAVLAVAVPAVAGRGDLMAAGDPDRAQAAYAAEVVRIQAHVDNVLRELRTSAPPDLSPAQRAARNAHIAELEAYRDRGLFPHNHDFADEWTPYFVDHRGVLCAVAHLLATSGRADIVERVARTNNNVWVADLAGDAEFERWLDASGLTLAEAARIQVPYVETPEEAGGSVSANRVNTAVAVIAGSLGAATIYWNARSSTPERSRLRAALGYTAGAIGLAVAASRMDADGAPLALGIATGTIGLGSAVMATRTLLAHRDGAQEQAAPATEVQPTSLEPVSLSIAPSVAVRNDRLAPGISLSVKF